MGWKAGLGASLALMVAAAVYVFACALSVGKYLTGMQGAGYSSSSGITFRDLLAITLGLFKHGRFWVPFVQQVPLV